MGEIYEDFTTGAKGAMANGGLYGLDIGGRQSNCAAHINHVQRGAVAGVASIQQQHDTIEIHHDTFNRSQIVRSSWSETRNTIDSC